MFAIKHVATLLLALTLTAPLSLGQDLELDDLLGTGGQFGPKKAEVSARLITGRLETGAVAYLHVDVILPLNHYIYSLNPDFAGCTEITLGKIEGLEPIDAEFKPTRKPKAKYDEILEETLEKFHDDITWVKRFKITDARAAAISGQLTGQYCTEGKNGQGGNCTPIRPPAEFAVALEVDDELASEPAEAAVFEYTEQPTRGKNNKPDPLSLKFSLTPSDAKVGDEVTLNIAMTLVDGWHVFSQKQNPENTGLPTVLELSGVAGLEPVGPDFVPNHEPEAADPFNDGKTQLLFHDTVVWSRKMRVLAEPFAVQGSIRYQTCKNACLAPHTVEFALGNPSLQLVSLASSSDAPIVANSDGSSADDTAASGSFIDRIGAFFSSFGLPGYLALAFLGGLILNVMPCVLPVLAIKVLSFVKQAGEKRSTIFILNGAYALGVIAVFLVLAGLAVFLKLGWGQLFQRPEFNLVMAGVIFAMALSLLGVFEIPIPGMGGGQSKEGPFGAFLTGILATILATPCSGPFLGPTLVWSVRQTNSVTFLIWAVMGLGMASPYLLFAVVPGAVKLLPKPGMWMVRFKEFAGFVLLGTVIYFIWILEPRFVVPFLAAMLALGLALWMIGSLYQHNSATAQKMKVRIAAIAVCLCGLWLATNLTKPASANQGGELEIVEDGKTLPWQAFTEARLMSLLEKKETVMIDFSAQWCQSCKANELIAINTPETLGLVKEHNIIPLYADWTRANPEIDKYLERFDSISIPLTVIIPEGEIDNAVILRDAFTQGVMTKAIKKAVSNRKVAQAN